MIKISKKLLSLTLSAFMLFSIGSPKAFAVKDTTIGSEISNYDDEKAISDRLHSFTTKDNKDEDPNEVVRLIVKMNKPSASEIINRSATSELLNKGGTSGLFNKSTASGLLNRVNTTEAVNVKKQVIENQNLIKKQVKNISKSEIRNSFGYLINGFSTTAKRKDINKIKAISGVSDVEIVNSYKIDMNSAVQLTQAKQVWEELGYKGEGTVVSIIDSGIDVKHKDLKLTDIKKAKIKSEANSYCTLKVPYVYNYADKNYEIVDKNPATDMHGMHVAGIVAANGDVKGVAPEAQLLGMKVFSNNPDNPSAFADDIVAAIEDSVIHGADVINMSLGSPSGFVDANDSEQVAVRKATEKGVMVVVSGGNSYYSTYPVKNPNIPDTGLVGAPGIAKEALQVASYENTKVSGVALDYKADNNVKGQMLYTTSEVKPENVLKNLEGYEIVDLGAIDNDDVNSELYAKAKGKIALIQKLDVAGKTSSYGQKKLNAQNAGAIGVIFYGVDDALVNTAPKDGVTIPCICISKKDAETLKSLINSNLKLNFNGNIMIADNSNTGKMSDFSSWGPTPNLEFKPEITGVGGNIWSLANDNKYQSMSGTSMSSPHVAGAEALILGGKKTQNLSVPTSEIINFAKNISMNTSKILVGADNVPISPRNQGAGLIQIKDAINNNVTVTYNGKAAVALKEIGKEKTFEVNVTNYGDKKVTYTLENGGILTEIKSNTDKDGKVISEVHDINIDGAKMAFSNNSVTVEPGKSLNVSVTITIPDGFETEQFVEGYVKFKSETDGAPSLSIPYIGFYGDWSKPLVVDKPIWDKDHVANGSLLIGSHAFGAKWLGVARGSDEEPYTIPENVAISTVTEDYLRPVYAYLNILRNAKEIRTEIVDSNGNVIRKLGVEYDVRKNTSMPNNSTGKSIYSSRWDVKVYNPTTKAYEYVKDGQYYYRIKAKADIENAKEQVFEMPIKVDSVAPKIEIVSENTIDTLDNGYTLKWKASDELSGLAREVFANGRDTGAPMVKVNGTRISSLLNSLKLKDEGNGVFSFTVKKGELRKGQNVITVDITDNAGNSSTATFNLLVKDGAIPTNATRTTNCTNGFAYKDIVDGKYTVKGVIGDNVDTLTVNDVPATLDKNLGTFSATIPVKDQEENTITLVPKDKDGNIITDIFRDGVYKVIFDTKAPEITVDESNMLPCDLDGITEKIVTNKNTVTIKGKVNEKFLSDFRINNNSVVVENNEFSTDVTVPNGPSVIDITATDKAGNITIKSYFVVADIPESKLSYEFNIQSNMILTADNVEKGNDGKYYLPVACKLSKSVKQVRIQDKVVPVKDLVAGAYVPIEDGIVKIAVYIQDTDGTVAADYMYKLYFDSTAPEINLKSPHTVNTNVDDKSDYLVKLNLDGKVNLKGDVTDNAFGYTFFINGEQVASAQYLEALGADGTRRTFDENVPAKVGDVIELKAVDLFGNTTIKNLTVIKGDEVPTITVTGVEKDKVYNTDVTPVINVEKGTYIAILDDKIYDGSPITKEGVHKLVVNASNLAGNSSNYEVSFTIDKTAPEIAVSGVEEGKVYTEAVTPEVKANEKATITMTIDGKVYDGNEIKELGKHTLVIIAVDEAGNKSEKTISFTIEEKKVNEEKPKDDEDKPVDKNKGDNKGTKDEPTKNTGANTNTSGKTSDGTKLVKTGSLLDMNLMLVAGATLMGIGAFLASNKKRRKEN